VGWVGPTGRANARQMMNSAITITSSLMSVSRGKVMGFASAQHILRAINDRGSKNDKRQSFRIIFPPSAVPLKRLALNSIQSKAARESACVSKTVMVD
jgi:hypothetical protein